MKTQIEFTEDCEGGDFLKGECGYIDGYVSGADNRPWLVIVVGSRVVFAEFYQVKVLTPH